jgi:hypothetical protein
MIISLSSNNKLVFVMETECVFCEVRTEFKFHWDELHVSKSYGLLGPSSNAQMILCN